MNLVPVVLAISVASINYAIPLEYRHGAVAVVHFVDTQEEIDAVCGKAPPGKTKLGCETEKGEIVVPNPCNYPEASDDNSYAHLLCHEKAHVNGWLHKP